MKRQERNDLLAMLEGIAQSNGIAKEQLVEVVENAILTAARKSIHPASDLSVKLDLTTGELKAWAKLKVVEKDAGPDEVLLSEVLKKRYDVKLGDIVDWEVTPANFGRIAAQAGRQNITQQIRELQRRLSLDEFRGKVGKIVAGTVLRSDSKGIVVDLGNRTQGVVTPEERINTEHFKNGDRICCLLKQVGMKATDPMLILSRRSALFLRRLFELQVAEIHDGIVEIVSIVRDPGSRAKVAVFSHDSHVDPVGSCVGVRGQRIRNIMKDLGNERIDVIQYSDDPMTYLTEAMHPARILNAEFNEAEKSVTVYVDRENSSLAIGRRAQNLRLASKITGWNITVKIPETEEEAFLRQKEGTINYLAEKIGISVDAASEIVAHGYLSLEGLTRATEDDFAQMEALTPEDIEKIQNALNEYRATKENASVGDGAAFENEESQTPESAPADLQ